MRILHRFLALGVLGAAFAVPGCEMLGWSCADDPTVSINGTWTITSINGQAIPANGYPLPSSTNRLTVGKLHFARNGITCSDNGTIEAERGSVAVDYTLATSAGVANLSEVYAGDFVYYIRSPQGSGGIPGQVLLSANANVLTGSKTAGPGGIVTFSGTLPSLGGLTVVFGRVQ